MSNMKIHEMSTNETIAHVILRGLSRGEAILLCDCIDPPSRTDWCLCRRVPEPVAVVEKEGGGEGKAGGREDRVINVHTYT